MPKLRMAILSIWLLFAGMAIGPTAYGQYTESSKNKENGAPVFDTNRSRFTQGIKERAIDVYTLKKLRADDAFWYANLKPERSKPTDNYSFWLALMQRSWFQSLIWLIIAGGFATVLIWYLATLNIYLFRRAPRKLEATTTMDEREDIFSIDFAAQLQKAVSEQNYRLAVRLHFLHLLKLLAQKGIIQYQTDFTNADYIRQLQHTAYYKDFFTLTRRFEYTWYGHMRMSADAFAGVQKDFERFKQQISS